ncbi:hypothetical protein NDU88_006389 [Pleurodeles waltl]|uniref:Uncharacterized protein n=1 Tax=Pleurodeles waltl TaxID=8319 RepID=A0AAV7MZ29_PLEWA|nr:hypothetical protein NDU88_006389 [Pleurodeles waltl]
MVASIRSNQGSLCIPRQTPSAILTVPMAQRHHLRYATRSNPLPPDGRRGKGMVLSGSIPAAPSQRDTQGTTMMVGPSDPAAIPSFGCSAILLPQPRDHRPQPRDHRPQPRDHRPQPRDHRPPGLQRPQQQRPRGGVPSGSSRAVALLPTPCRSLITPNFWPSSGLRQLLWRRGVFAALTNPTGSNLAVHQGEVGRERGRTCRGSVSRHWPQDSPPVRFRWQAPCL